MAFLGLRASVALSVSVSYFGLLRRMLFVTPMRSRLRREHNPHLLLPYEVSGTNQEFDFTRVPSEELCV